MVLAATTDRRSGEPLTVGGLRTVRRGIDLAARWGLPMVTVVDTLGAQLSVAGEQSGIAGEISRVMLDLVVGLAPPPPPCCSAPAPGGAALALLGRGSDHRRLAHLGRAAGPGRSRCDPAHGGSHDPAQVAWEQQIGAHALADLGFIDHVVRESDPGLDGYSAARGRGLPARGARRAAAGARQERFAAWLT